MQHWSPLLLLHPLTLAVVVAGIGARIADWRWPPPSVLTTWALVPLLINSVIWYYGLPLFGWIFEGLGMPFLFGFVLPLNGVLFGVALSPIVWRWLVKCSTQKAMYLGIGIEFVILIINMVVLGQVDAFVGIAGFRPVRW